MNLRSDSSWIQTFTGKKFYPLDPLPDDIDLRDIAHALSNTCRFNGHTKKFYSVAQHSVLVSEVAPPEHALWGLLHDATEAYIADITRPVKQHWQEWYKPAEHRLMASICKRFNLPLDEPECIKHADLVILNTEKRDLMGPAPDVWSRDWLAKPLDYVIEPWAPETACHRFMQRYNQIIMDQARASVEAGLEQVQRGEFAPHPDTCPCNLCFNENC